jgi:tetratricopeptide (TPR) repeat protein
VVPPALVLHATILQSQHDFGGALDELDRALSVKPDDVQGWLTRATVLRVIGRYDDAIASCQHLAAKADPAVMTLCEQSLRALTGHLRAAYAAVESLSIPSFPPEARAWRYSELGEMATRMGHDDEAERWFRDGLQIAPEDFYMRAALADLLLRAGRANETLQLLTGYESIEPMLLRLALAHQALNDAQGAQVRALLSSAFDVEQRRGEAVHRREQARFLLDIDHQAEAALTEALENWKLQREPEDALILMRTAQAAHRPDAAAPALEFLRQHQLEDVRLDTLVQGPR